MENVVFETANHELTNESLRAWAEKYGGEWVTRPEFERGVLEDDGVRVFLDFSSADDLSEYKPDEIVAMERRLGGSPVGFVSIHIGHGETDADYARSNDLARRVARQLISKWCGYVDTNGIISWSDFS